jgi:mannose-6-phosphate isomerase-like protein (cupin superfamily)
MPFYRVDEIRMKRPDLKPGTTQQSVAGELMKASITTKPEGIGPPLHLHPNEEQFTLILQGNLHYILGEEERIVGPGDLVHVPRSTNHRSRPVGGPTMYFSVKSPAGDGDMNQDYHKAEGAEEAEKLYPGNA